MDKQNLFIFVADSLRYDYLPETVAAEGTVIPTLAPSPRSPSSFASLVTGKAVRSHAVRSFHDTLSPSHTTLFDRFEEGSYYDHEDDPVRKTVLQHAPPTKELAELDQGFVFFERAMESHFPYNEIPHGNPLKHQDMDAGELSQYSRRELRQRYQEGVDGVADHFWDHVQELEDRGLREDTLIVFTSDHGEWLGERVNGRRRYAHCHPLGRALVAVPTVFLDTDLDIQAMRSIDIPDTALALLGKEGLGGDGVNTTTQEVHEGEVIGDSYAAYRTRWRFDDRWRPAHPFQLRKDILREDLRILLDRFGHDILPRPETGMEETAGVDI